MLLPRFLSAIAAAAGLGTIASICWTLFEQSKRGKRVIRGWLLAVALLAVFGVTGPLRASEATLIYNGCHSFSRPFTAQPTTTATIATEQATVATAPAILPIKLAVLPPTFCDSIANLISHPTRP